MSKSSWGNIGAWAAEAERAEAEEREAAEMAAAAQPQPQPSFPSLKEAVSTGSKQKKKTKMSLQEFAMQTSGHSRPDYSRGLTPDEMLRLPTGPKQRSPEEMQGGRFTGGFSNYGSGNSNQGRAREYEGRRSYGFPDEDRRGDLPNTRVSEMNQPSRADGVDNWASMKKETVPEPARPGGKYSFLGGGGGIGTASRADGVDNWASSKKPFSPPRPQPRSSSFGSGFSRPESDRWPRNEQRLTLDPPKSEGGVVEKVNKANPFGEARPRVEVLADKGLDWKKLASDIDAKKRPSVSGGSRPTSSQSNRPETPLSSRSETAAPGTGEVEMKPKPKVNPFGDAKPREVLLEEKGLDWKKIDLDLDHRRVNRPDTEEEKNLRDEIEHLKKEVEQKSGDEETTVRNLIIQREQELELLVRQLDDKVRYSQKFSERPGSGGGRGGGYNERPGSGGGRGGGYNERPGSGGGRGGGYNERPGSGGGRGGGYNERPGSGGGRGGGYNERPGSGGGRGGGYNERAPSRPGAYEESRTGFHGPPSMMKSYEDQRSGYPGRPRSRPGRHDDPRAGSFERLASRGGAYEDSRAGFAERTPSRPGSYEDPRPGGSTRPGAYEEPRGGFSQRYEEPRAVDYNEGPRSRGSGNSWARSSDERRTFQGGGGRGFLGSRDGDRSGSRW